MTVRGASSHLQKAAVDKLISSQQNLGAQHPVVESEKERVREREKKKHMVARSIKDCRSLSAPLFSPHRDHAIHFPARISHKAGPQAAKALPTMTKGTKAPSAARERLQLSCLPWQGRWQGTHVVGVWT